MSNPVGSERRTPESGESELSRAESVASMMELWNAHGLGETFSEATDEMLVVHNTFLELLRMTDLQAVSPNRFISAPAMFGSSSVSPEKEVQCAQALPAPAGAVPPEASLETTVMMRNIPTRISSKSLIEVVLSYRKPLVGLVDFLYLPIDFKTNKNLGYCFINFCSAADAAGFIARFNDKKYVFCETSEKRLQITLSNRQGFLKNLEVFTQTKMLDTWPDQFRPLAVHEGRLVPISSDLLACILAPA